jgi:hypothetical protein
MCIANVNNNVKSNRQKDDDSKICDEKKDKEIFQEQSDVVQILTLFKYKTHPK